MSSFPFASARSSPGQRVDDVRIEDNDFRYTDEGILSVSDGSGWGYAQLRGRLGDVRIYRNHSLETGRRPKLFGTGTGMEVSGARTVEDRRQCHRTLLRAGHRCSWLEGRWHVGRCAVHARF